MSPGPSSPDRIRVVLAALHGRQRELVENALQHANRLNQRLGETEFELLVVVERGLGVLKRAAEADVVIFGLEDEELPGEASHVLATCPGVKVVGVDTEGWARVVVGAVLEPLSRDLPTVIRWITRHREEAAGLRERRR